MCTTNIYEYVHPDGRTDKSSQPNFCSAARHGKTCANNVVFQHPPQFVQPASYLNSPFPPTPPAYASPAPSTPVYRSGDESDRSRKSSSGRKRRSSSVYLNGTKILNLNRREGDRRGERIVLVDNPTTPHTPPTATWALPHTAPSSPNHNTYVYDSSPSYESHRPRPVIVDERYAPAPAAAAAAAAAAASYPVDDYNRVCIEVVDPHEERRSGSHSRRSSKHSRHGSSSSRDSRHASEDEERRRRRRERKERKEQEEEQQRQEKLRLRIAKANAEIASRPAVPVPDAPVYKRGAVEVDAATAQLGDAMRRLSFEEVRREEKAERLLRKEQRREEEAQRQRLVERMQPRRRASTSASSRHHRVVYSDSTFRME